MHVIYTDFEKAFDKVSDVHLQFTTSHLDSVFVNVVVGRI